MPEPRSDEERRRIRVIVIFLALAFATALIGAWVYSLPSLGTAPLPTLVPTSTGSR